MRIRDAILILLLVALCQNVNSQMVALSRAKLPPSIQEKLKKLDAAEVRSAQARAHFNVQSLVLSADEPDL